MFFMCMKMKITFQKNICQKINNKNMNNIEKNYNNNYIFMNARG